MTRNLYNINDFYEPFKQIQKIIESQNNQLSEITRLASERFQKPFEEINRFFEKINNSSILTAKNILSDFNENIKDIGKQFSENLKRTPGSLILLAKYGWYLDFESDINLPIELGNLITENKIEEVDSYLVKYYTKYLDQFFSNLFKNHPMREIIFTQIYEAHKSENYYISVPCVLSQIDGICFDYTSKKYFIKNKKDKQYKYLPEVAEEFSNVSSSIVKAFIAPILTQNPMISHESSLNDYPVHLNRNTIMHGIDIEYGTQLNSLKCLSLLFYISDMLTLLKEKNTNNIPLL
jgi:hypothetical protein